MLTLFLRLYYRAAAGDGRHLGNSLSIKPITRLPANWYLGPRTAALLLAGYAGARRAYLRAFSRFLGMALVLSLLPDAVSG